MKWKRRHWKCNPSVIPITYTQVMWMSKWKIVVGMLDSIEFSIWHLCWRFSNIMNDPEVIYFYGSSLKGTKKTRDLTFRTLKKITTPSRCDLSTYGERAIIIANLNGLNKKVNELSIVRGHFINALVEASKPDSSMTASLLSW